MRIRPSWLLGLNVVVAMLYTAFAMTVYVRPFWWGMVCASVWLIWTVEFIFTWPWPWRMPAFVRRRIQCRRGVHEWVIADGDPSDPVEAMAVAHERNFAYCVVCGLTTNIEVTTVSVRL